MSWMRSIRERLKGLVRTGQMDDGLREELQFHVDRQTEKNLAAGMEPREARRQALIAFGGVERYREQARDEQTVRPLEDLFRDLRFAFRTLIRTPGLVVVTVLSLGLGIAASSAVFSVGTSLLFGKPGPLGEPENVVALYASGEEGRLYEEVSMPDFLDVRSQMETLGGLAAHRVGVVSVGPLEERDRLMVEMVTRDYFQVLQVTPVLGRAFSPDETVLGRAERVLVLSHDAWQDRFEGDIGVLGRVMELDGEPFTVIGVAPEGLRSRMFQVHVDGWIPLGIPGGTYRATPERLADRGDQQFFMVGRLAPGRTIDQAQTEANLVAARLHEEYSRSWEDTRGQNRKLTVLSEAESRIPPDGRLALLGVAGLLLLGALLILGLACSNVASLLLARAFRRSREMAIRTSLGAGRGRLFRMLLAESLVLALGGGALGLYLSHLATDYMGSFPLPFDVPLRFDFGMDGRVVLFTLLLAVGASLVAGIGPALQGSKSSLSSTIKGASGKGSRGRLKPSFRSLLVVGQVASATLLVIGAGLAFRSVQASATYDLGLKADGVAVMWKEPPEGDLSPTETRNHFLELAERVGSHPEVEGVALARIAEAHVFMEDFATALVQGPDESPVRVRFNAVTPGYLELLQIPLVEGRGIRMSDREGAPEVAVVNEAFLRRFFPGDRGMGSRFTVPAWFDADNLQDTPEKTLEIVGIVKDPSRGPGDPIRPFFWISYLQDPPVRAILHAKGRQGVGPVLPVLRQEAPSDPGEFTLIEPGPYQDLIDYRFLGYRILSRILAFAGLFALALASIGVFGIVSYTVTQRFREMAIRQAVGARKGDVIRRVLWYGLRTAGMGLALGLVLALAAGFLARSALLGVAPFDPLAVGGGMGILLSAAVAAGALPARRLASAEPMNVLREE